MAAQARYGRLPRAEGPSPAWGASPSSGGDQAWSQRMPPTTGAASSYAGGSPMAPVGSFFSASSGPPGSLAEVGMRQASQVDRVPLACSAHSPQLGGAPSLRPPLPHPQMQQQQALLEQQMLTGGSSGSWQRPLAAGSPPAITSRDSGNPISSKVGECQDQQCAEEECNPEECGDELRPPRDDNFTCGIDRRPLLPVVLVSSTFLGALCVLMLQLPMLKQLVGSAFFVRVVFLVLDVATLTCMVYCAMSDPGQLSSSSEQSKPADPGLQEDAGELPRRAHKAWLYRLPVRRYDHYCRWLTNVIGLLNHREFLVMCTGLVAIGGLGIILDIVLLLDQVRRSGTIGTDMILLMHLIYSVAVVLLAGPILRMHIGFVSRNELAQEWKNNMFYVAVSSRSGKLMPVNDLSDNEFNDRFDSFQYDPTRNPNDKGIFQNCWNFWCTPRWDKSQLGEF